jgi:hypothetical protein
MPMKLAAQFQPAGALSERLALRSNPVACETTRLYGALFALSAIGLKTEWRKRCNR